MSIADGVRFTYAYRPSAWQQVLAVCMLVGIAVVLRWLVQGALIVLAALAYGLYVAAILTARALCWLEDFHAAGLERLARDRERVVSDP